MAGSTNSRQSHLAVPPGWNCAACHQPWPCDRAKIDLLAEYRQSPSSLTVYMHGHLAAAIDDLAATTDGPARPDLWTRFVGWTRPDLPPADAGMPPLPGSAPRSADCDSPVLPGPAPPRSAGFSVLRFAWHAPALRPKPAVRQTGAAAHRYGRRRPRHVVRQSSAPTRHDRRARSTVQPLERLATVAGSLAGSWPAC
jgi:hypothetical protein